MWGITWLLLSSVFRSWVGFVSLLPQTRPDFGEILPEYRNGQRECSEAPRYEMDLYTHPLRASGLNVMISETSRGHHGSDKPGSFRRWKG